MTDDILVGTNAELTVGEAACPDDAVVFGATADDEPAFEPCDGEHVAGSEAQPAVESETETDGHGAWKIHCRECSQLVPAKPYCYECGAVRPTDGDYYVVEERDER